MTNEKGVVFPNESDTYRAARDELLSAEIALRRQTEDVAAMRRALPQGGALAQDYTFSEGHDARPVRLSELFDENRRALAIYSFMYAPQSDQAPCPMCVSLLDGLNGSAPHIMDRVSLAVVARAPADRLRDWGDGRGWSNLRLLSSQNNTYNVDYHGERDGRQIPMLNIFETTETGIYHVYGTESFFAPPESGQHPRHADALWPVWALFDLTREGRGADWFPKLSY